MTEKFSLHNKRVLLTGATGMIGSALKKRLEEEACKILAPTRQELDLSNQSAVGEWMEKHRPQVVFHLAARVGGIYANKTFPAEFMYQNLTMQTNVIHSAWKIGVEKLLFLGSSCTYPKTAPQPLSEDTLLQGHPEPTNVWYAVAKLAGIKMCQAYRQQYGCDFIVGMPANSYGIGDNFDPQQSHVIPALMRRFHDARENGLTEIEIWGTGKPQRELIYVTDVADACVFLMENYSSDEIVNIGSSQEVTIAELAKTLSQVIEFEGNLCFDTSKPDGIMRKVLDNTRLFEMGWRPKISLKEGLKQTYDWFKMREF